MTVSMGAMVVGTVGAAGTVGSLTVTGTGEESIGIIIVSPGRVGSITGTSIGGMEPAGSVGDTGARSMGPIVTSPGGVAPGGFVSVTGVGSFGGGEGSEGGVAVSRGAWPLYGT